MSKLRPENATKWKWRSCLAKQLSGRNFGEKQPSVICRWWFLIVCFYQHACKAESLSLAKLCKVCKATQATPALVPKLWALEMRATNRATLCSDLWAYSSWQHCHCSFGSVSWPTLMSKLGFTNSLLSQLSHAALLHCKPFPPLQRLICSAPVWTVNHQLWENSPCSDVSISLWFYYRGKKYSHWAAFLLLAGISPVVPHPLFMLIQGEIVFSWSKQDLTQEDWKT